MRYEEAIAELERLGVMPKDMPQLAPMVRALRRSGLLSKMIPRKTIIIAGTNGKGSIAATLSRLLHDAKKRVGLYTSPHLVSTTERFRIDEQDLSKADFVLAYNSLRDIIHEEKLTHFEALTLIAAFVFHSGQCGPPVEWGIWEVGLGGRYDATNAIPHHYCGMARLGLDHQNILGTSLEEIADQKFGVVGDGAIVVHSPMDDALGPLRERVSVRTGCRWIAARAVDLVGMATITTPWGKAELSLCGPRAAENTATALTLFERMGFEPGRHLSALADVRWPGRFQKLEVMGISCPVYLSGDHNPQGIDSLLQILSKMAWKTLHLIVGIGKDKDVSAILQKLAGLPRMKLYLTETTLKPLALDEYPRPFKELAVHSDKDVLRLLSAANREASPADLIVVTGSLYLVGSVLERMSGGFSISG